MDYRVALGALRLPAVATDPAALRKAIQARQQLREQYFQGAEYEALFGHDALLENLAVERLEIGRNPHLTAQERQQALQQAEAQLPDALRAERAQMTAHLAVAEQTAAFDARQLSDQERYQQRAAQYGDATAQALAQLDRNNTEWQSRLAQYSQARAQGWGDGELQRLRHQLFTPREQLRLEGALALQASAVPAR